MGSNKTIPPDVVTAMELAEAAGWKVSNRNRKVTITPPGHPPLTIGHGPNELTMRDWRQSCARFNLLGQGPARTPEDTERLIAVADQAGLAEAERRNQQRRAYEVEQKKKAAQIEDARKKAEAAIQQGLKPQEIPMPKTARSTTTRAAADLFPVFDPALIGTTDYSKFLLSNGQYYCIECWEMGNKETFKAPQGIATHRGFRHQMYTGGIPVHAPAQETSRVTLPADVDTAMEMLRTAMAEALSLGADPDALAAQEAELIELRGKLETATKQADADRKDFDKRFLEAQGAFDKQLGNIRTELEGVREAEIEALMKNFLGILVEIRKATETLSPIQAIAKIDTIVSDSLKQ